MLSVLPCVQGSPCDGYLSQCSLYFKPNNFCPPLAMVEVRIDVLMNGVSIFPESSPMVWGVGETGIQYKTEFNASPFAVKKGDIFSLNVLSGDGTAHDGVLAVELLVI